MSDSGDNKKSSSSPSWQSVSSPEQSQSKAEADQNTLETAKRFLEEDDIRDAPTDKKIAFLESKGVKSEDIQRLLGISSNAEATAPKPTTQETGQPPAPSTTSPVPAQSYTPSNNIYHPRRDTPPIITYPEFLTTPQHPTPLITKPRLLTTLYIFSTLSFLLYGTSKYLVTPMVASLTTSRLSLLDRAKENLKDFVSKLEGVVSEVPPTTAGKLKLLDGDNYKDSESESDSDPTEVFHRDIGVQTSLPPTTPSSPVISPKSSTLDTQSSRLHELKESIQSLLEEDTTHAQENQELEATVGIVKEYCDQLAYVAPLSTYGYNSYSSGSRQEEKNDEIAKVKAAIRGVKGTLLSARSFPGGVRASAR